VIGRPRVDRGFAEQRGIEFDGLAGDVHTAEELSTTEDTEDTEDRTK
jgi:hypothetical protein